MLSDTTIVAHNYIRPFNKYHYPEGSSIFEDIAELVENLNTYVSTKETPLSIATLDPAIIFQSLGQEYSEELRTRAISWVVPDDIPVIKADRTSLVRAMRNLIDNALKYGGNGLSTIEIGYEDDGDSHVSATS